MICVPNVIINIESIIECIKHQVQRYGRSYKEGHTSREDIHFNPVTWTNERTTSNCNPLVNLGSTNKVFIWLPLICVAFEEVVKLFTVTVSIAKTTVESRVLSRVEWTEEPRVLLDVEGMVEPCVPDLDDVWLNGIDFVVELKVLANVVEKKAEMVVLIPWGEVREVKMVEGGMYLESSEKSESDRLQFFLQAALSTSTVSFPDLGQHTPLFRLWNPRSQSMPLHGFHFVYSITVHAV